MLLKAFKTVRTHWKKSIFFTGCGLYVSKYLLKWHKEGELMREYCLRAREIGRQTITASERPRKIVVFLNPAAKDGKTKYLLEKHVLPLLHLAGIEIHVVRTEHEGQAKSYMSVLDKSIVDAIVVAGGDGTLSEIVTGLLRRDDKIAQRIPIGLLPFGNTNSFVSRIFPPSELEVERFCKASLAIIQNRHALADVIEVIPQRTPKPFQPDGAANTEEPEPSISQSDNKKVYLLSDLKWGIHSDVERRKKKYWYMPGPLKQYYCYLKAAAFGDWPLHIKASIEFSPPCQGCSKCLVTPIKMASVPKPAKSVWWWPTDNRTKTVVPVEPDPRLQISNPECGAKYQKDIDSPELRLTSAKQTDHSGVSQSLMQLSLTPPLTTRTNLLTSQTEASSDCETFHVSSITMSPHTSEPWYIMDSEKYEVMPATFTLLKDQIKIFTLSPES